MPRLKDSRTVTDLYSNICDKLNKFAEEINQSAGYEQCSAQQLNQLLILLEPARKDLGKMYQNIQTDLRKKLSEPSYLKIKINGEPKNDD